MVSLDLSLSSCHVTENSIFNRVYSSAAVDEDRLRVYLTGGRASPRHCLEDVVEVDVITGEWRRTDWRLDVGRWRHCSAVLEGHLVMVGGGGGGDTLIGLDLATGQWLTSVRLTSQVLSASCVVWRQAGLLVWSGGLEDMRPSSAVRTVKICKKELRVRRLEVEISPRFSHTSHEGQAGDMRRCRSRVHSAL